MATGTINDIPYYSSGAWIASASSAIGTQLTAKIPIKKGVNIISIMTPSFTVNTANSRLVMSLRTDQGLGIGYYFSPEEGGSDVETIVLNISADTNLWAATSSSASFTFTSLERGGIAAVRII